MAIKLARKPLCEGLDIDLLEKFIAVGHGLMAIEGDICPSCLRAWDRGHRMVIVEVELPNDRMSFTTFQIIDAMHATLSKEQRLRAEDPHAKEERPMTTKRFPLCETVSKDMLERFLVTGENLSISALDRCPSCNNFWTLGHRMVLVDVEVDPGHLPVNAVEVSQLLHDQLTKREARHTNDPFDSTDPPRDALIRGFQKIANFLRIGDGLPINKVLRAAEAVIQQKPDALVTTPNARHIADAEHLRQRVKELESLAENRRLNLEERSVKISQDKHQIERLTSENAALQHAIAREMDKVERLEAPIPMILFCPACKERHIDEGYFERKAHTSHSCQNPKCGITWKQALVPTVGVSHLPGYLNGCTCIFCGPTKHKAQEIFDTDQRRCRCGCLAILHEKKDPNRLTFVHNPCNACRNCTGFVDAMIVEGTDAG